MKLVAKEYLRGDNKQKAIESLTGILQMPLPGFKIFLKLILKCTLSRNQY
jgi:hypothetical protein